MKLIEEVKRVRSLPNRYRRVETIRLLRNIDKDNDVYTIIDEGYLELGALLHDIPDFDSSDVIREFRPHLQQLNISDVLQLLSRRTYCRRKISEATIKLIMRLVEPDLYVDIAATLGNRLSSESIDLLLREDYTDIIKYLIYRNKYANYHYDKIMCVIFKKLLNIYKDKKHIGVRIPDEYVSRDVIHYHELKHFDKDSDDILYLIMVHLNIDDNDSLWDFILDLIKLGEFPLKFAAYAMFYEDMWVKLINNASDEQIDSIIYDDKLTYRYDSIASAIRARKNIK